MSGHFEYLSPNVQGLSLLLSELLPLATRSAYQGRFYVLDVRNQGLSKYSYLSIIDQAPSIYCHADWTEHNVWRPAHSPLRLMDARRDPGFGAAHLQQGGTGRSLPRIQASGKVCGRSASFFATVLINENSFCPAQRSPCCQPGFLRNLPNAPIADERSAPPGN